MKRLRKVPIKVLTAAVLSAGGIVFLLGLSAGPAAADFIFNLDTGNSGISGFTSPYVSVDVNLTSSTTATLTYTALSSGGNTYLLGDSSIIDANINATSFTASAITAGLSNGGAGQVDGFGTFNQTWNYTDGCSSAINSAAFSVTDTSGTWATAQSVLTPNANGAIAAAHVYVNRVNGSCAATGFAAGSGGVTPPVVVPEPTSLSMFGFGLVSLGGLGGLIRRRRRV